MPRAAYCSECGSWTWIGRDGACVKGHPQSCLGLECELGQDPMTRKPIPPAEPETQVTISATSSDGAPEHAVADTRVAEGGYPFLDWLFGAPQMGWAKTAFLSLILAIPIWLTIYSSGGSPGGGRFAFIALGYPLLALLRWLYWGWRRGQLKAMLLANDPRAIQEIDAILRWRPRLWSELRQNPDAGAGGGALSLFMAVRPRIQKALQQEFANDNFRNSWLVSWAHDAGGKRASAQYFNETLLDFGGMSHWAAGGYTVRAFRVISSLVDTPVEVTMEFQRDVFCRVSTKLQGQTLFCDVDGSLFWGAPVEVYSPPIEGGTPCLRCTAPTDGVYASNVFQGLTEDVALSMRHDYPTLHLCAACSEQVADECVRRAYEEASTRRADKSFLEAPASGIGLTESPSDLKSELKSIFSDRHFDVLLLIEALTDDDSDASDAAAMELARVGKPAVSPLIDCVANDEARRRGALKALLFMAQKAVPELTRIAADDPDKFRADLAAMALEGIAGRMGGDASDKADH